MRWYVVLLLMILMTGCGSETAPVNEQQIEKVYQLDMLEDDIYFFPSKQNDSAIIFQPLQKWDLIFAGSKPIDESGELDFSRLIPGDFSHVLLYLGKDASGNAYVAEMALADHSKIDIGLGGIVLDGRVFLHHMGKDYGVIEDENSDNLYDYSKYDYYVAKRLRPNLRNEIKTHENAILAAIEEDLNDGFLYQSPIFFNFDLNVTKKIYITDDGFTNGSHCAEYISLLFESYAGVCLDDITISPEEIEYYFMNDDIGKMAKLPAKYNFYSDGDLYFYELFSEGFTLLSMPPRESVCNPFLEDKGMVTPDKLYNSSSLEIISPSQ